MARKILQVYGIARVDGRLREMSGPRYAKILSRGLRAGIKVIVTAQRAIAPYPSLRAAIGSRLLKRSKEGLGAKAGAGIGKKISRAAGAYRPSGATVTGTQRGGVGISARNIHWYVLGTKERYTGSRRVRSRLVPKGMRAPTGARVHFTGKMPANLFLRRATDAVAPQAVAVMNQMIADGVQQLWKEGK